MTWIALDCPEGMAYVNPAQIAAVGPAMRESVGGQTRTLRLLYLAGGHGLAMFDTLENLAQIGLGVEGRPS